MDKIQKIHKIEKVKNNLNQQNQQEFKNKIKEPCNFGSVLDEEKRKLEEKEKREKSKNKDALSEIYIRELRKAIAAKEKINKQHEEKQEEIEQDER